MQRSLSVFGLALMASVIMYQPSTFAQDGSPTVDESISAILDGSGDAVVVDAPATVTKPVAAVADNDAAVVDPVAAMEPAAVVEPVAAVEPAAVESVAAVEPAAVESVAAVEPAAAEPVAAVEPEVMAVKEKASEAVGDELVVQNGSGGEGAPEADGILVSMAFEDAPLPDVIKAFRDATGANIISGWTNATAQLVSMRLDNVPWHQGLSSILSPYGLELKEEPRGSNVYIIKEKSTLIPRYTQTFELKHAKAGDIAQLLKSTLDASCLTVAFPSANAVVVKATEEQLKECESIIKVLDKPTQQVYIEARFVRLSSSASKKLGMKWDTLAGFGAKVALGGGMQVTDGTIATYDVTGTSAERVTKISKTGVKTKSDWRETKTTSTLIPEEQTAATIANITSEDMTWKKASAFGGVLSMTEFGLTLSAFENMDGVQMFSNPKIIVNNETQARIDMTTKEPNVEIDYQAATQAGQRDSISSKLAVIPGKTESWVGEAFFSYGISLEVTPRISSTGLITVEIVPSISSLDTTTPYRFVGVEGSANQYPIIKMQRLETSFTMADGKTAVIGGLTETTEGNVDSGIPLLRKIPWVGPRLFGWKSREKLQEEIIIFVTVGIIDGNTIQQDAGMPKNAVLGRGLFNGSLKEPGDRTDEEMFDLESRPLKGFRIK